LSLRSCTGFHFVALLILLLPIPVAAQQVPAPLEVPDKFNVDLKTAARLRPELLAQSTAASHYAVGRRVFEKLTEQTQVPRGVKPVWELRIVNDGELNAFSSPDGTIYVESSLADLAGTSAGLWAAILSHEIEHVIRRDWARRYLYADSLRSSGGPVVLGDAGISPAAYTDATAASQDLAQFCRRLELDADLAGLMLMARAGYHPDFVPALHHLLRAQSAGKSASSIFAMHPCWEERDRELDRAYIVASIEFDRRWPERYGSPGGNPPTLVFADEPSVKRMHDREWEIRVPMRCQNLAGAVEVVLQTYSSEKVANDLVRQLTGCTSPKTMITFALNQDAPRALWAEVFVLDAQGAVLSRAAIPRLGK